jgi:hypothetical protein
MKIIPVAFAVAMFATPALASMAVGRGDNHVWELDSPPENEKTPREQALDSLESTTSSAFVRDALEQQRAEMEADHSQGYGFTHPQYSPPIYHTVPQMGRGGMPGLTNTFQRPPCYVCN